MQWIIKTTLILDLQLILIPKKLILFTIIKEKQHKRNLC